MKFSKKSVIFPADPGYNGATCGDMWQNGRGVAMKLTTGLTVSLAVLVTGLYTWGISTDPEGFRGLIRDHSRPIDGAVPLSGVEIPGEGDETLTWKAISDQVSQAVIFKLKPPDLASLDESFLAYLDGLKAAVEARDLAGVLARSAVDVAVSFGQPERPVGLAKLLTSQDGPGVWQQLESVLSVPVAKGADGAYCAPWFSCLAMPEEAGLVEPFETVFVTGENIPVYDVPSDRSEPLLLLSWDAVRLAGAIDEPGWMKVILPADRVGYIARDRVRMMFDTRVDFEPLESGRWAMTSLVVGE